VYDLAQLARRLEAGDWLQIGEVAALLNVSRNTVDRRMRDGTIGTRMRAGTKWRVCNPADVLRLLEESITERRGTD
jgi:excisionase family DNA binding protein